MCRGAVTFPVPIFYPLMKKSQSLQKNKLKRVLEASMLNLMKTKHYSVGHDLVTHIITQSHFEFQTKENAKIFYIVCD